MNRIITIFSILMFFAVSQFCFAKPGGIDSLFKHHKLRGSFVLLDNSLDKFTIYNDARCRKRFSPASTFKLPHTLIALELGIVKDTNFIFKWDSTARANNDWNKDMNLAEAMRVSCVPCFQEIARLIGQEKMQQWLEKFNYGNKYIGSSVDDFWLSDSLKISQFEQIDFLKKMYFGIISAKKKNINVLKSIMLRESNPKYKIFAKTGTVVLDRFYAWYVGYVEKDSKVYFFALNINDRLPQNNPLIKERIALTNDILKYLNIID